MTLRGKSIMVTGGAGFIGSHLVDRLIKETPSNLVVVDNFFLGKETNLQEAKQAFRLLKVHNLDVSDRQGMEALLTREEVDVVFNLAVIPLPASFERPGWVYEHNVDITLCLCELARRGCFQTLIHFSSSEAYGTCQYAPMGEDHPLAPTTPYAASKAATDHLVLSYAKSFGIDTSIVRPFNNYGPRQNQGLYAGVIPITIKRILDGEAPVIYGDGNQTRDFLYVTDTADSAVRIYDCPGTRGKVMNVASGTEISINDLVALIAQELKCGRETSYEKERPGDVRRLLGGIGLAAELIGFEPTVRLERGLHETIQWYNSHAASLKR